MVETRRSGADARLFSCRRFLRPKVLALSGRPLRNRSRAPALVPARPVRTSTPVPPQPRYAELAVATNFSFLRGASHPEELVATAISLKLAGIGIADRNSLAGVVRAHLFLRNNKNRAGDFRVVTGARLVFRDGTPDVLAYPQDRAAYGRLTRLLTDGNRDAPKGECHLTRDDLLRYIEGQQLIVMDAGEPDDSALLAKLSDATPG